MAPKDKEKVVSVSRMMDYLGTVVQGIAQTFGPRCEVVLHDLRNLDHSIVKIVNGHVTGRDENGSITDFALKLLKSKSRENLFYDYPSVAKDGRPLKSSTCLFRDDQGRPMAAICINLDVADILHANRIIQDMFNISEETKYEEAVETFESDIQATLNNSAERVITKFGKAVTSMTREDKIAVVKDLDDQGVFLIKGAVKFMAGKLNVSKYTIYNYLEQARSGKKAEDK